MSQQCLHHVAFKCDCVHESNKERSSKINQKRHSVISKGETQEQTIPFVWRTVCVLSGGSGGGSQ